MKPSFCKAILFAIFIFSFSPIFSQNLTLDIYGGVSNYQGDLQEKSITFSGAKLGGGLGAHYSISENWDIRGSVLFGQLYASDKGGKNKSRNLDFSTNLFEVMVGAQYNFTSLSEVVTPYLFAGLGVFHFNPYTYDTAGNKFYLEPLSTEGQGFTIGKQSYGLTQFSIPFGAGVDFRLTDRLSFGLEIGFRKLFTDYLDDVSDTYIDRNLLLNARGPKAVELSWRGGEINPTATYPAPGTARGSKNTDWYYFILGKISFEIGNGGGGRNNSKSGIGCPINVL